MKRAFISLAVCATLMACSDDPIREPTRVVAPAPPPATPMFVLFGTVRDENGETVSGATAVIGTGPFQGRSAISNANGYFSFVGVSGSMWVQVFKDGYDRYTLALTVAADFALDVRLSKLIAADSIQLGQAIRSAVSTGDPPCDPIRWDARAPCKRFPFTAPSNGTLVIYIMWSGDPELDATMVDAQGQYVATSDAPGFDTARLVAPVEAGRSYEIRVNSYYGGQVFNLKAALEVPARQ
jgi:Carboxypeptidase regulatory-like domain